VIGSLADGLSFLNMVTLRFGVWRASAVLQSGMNSLSVLSRNI
jgi:hypothetical protein